MGCQQFATSCDAQPRSWACQMRISARFRNLWTSQTETRCGFKCLGLRADRRKTAAFSNGPLITDSLDSRCSRAPPLWRELLLEAPPVVGMAPAGLFFPVSGHCCQRILTAKARYSSGNSAPSPSRLSGLVSAPLPRPGPLLCRRSFALRVALPTRVPVRVPAPASQRQG